MRNVFTLINIPTVVIRAAFSLMQYVNGCLWTPSVMHNRITATAFKAFSRGPHKDNSWYLLKPAVWIDTNPIFRSFCNCENTLKSWSRVGGPRLMFPQHSTSRADQIWQMGSWDTADLWGIHYPPQTVCGDSKEPPTKEGEKAREAYVKEWWVGNAVLGNRLAIHTRGIRHEPIGKRDPGNSRDVSWHEIFSFDLSYAHQL